ncbi:MAG: glucodextranase DOMON-like domain-containing protein, partial [Arenimonas sp.]
PMRQWMLRITAYAQRLIDELAGLDWPESIKLLQRNWIGRSEGAEVHFKIADSSQTITVFTTRPDTLFGATYMVLAPEHSLVELVTTEDQWPDVRDYRDPAQTLSWQMSGLDDLNSDNPVVRQALRRSYGDWIRHAGVDAFRIDTAFYVPRAALDDFLHAPDADAPGVLDIAKGTGRDDFLVFGEGFAIDKPYEEAQARRIETLMQGDDGKPLLPGMLNFPLYGSIGDVFARGAPSAVLGHRIASMMRVHARPQLMPSFLDNHDVDRFLAGGSEAGLKQGLLLMFTLPGIPTIYYGTEQGLRGQRGAMFAAGSGSGGVDHFDTSAPLYRLIASLAALRREHRVFSRGRPTVLAESAAGPGVLAYRMSAEEESVLVVFNTGDSPALLDNLEVGGKAGEVLPPLFSLAGEAPRAQLHFATGRLDLVLPPRSGYAWSLAAQERIGAPEAPPHAVRMDAPPPQVSGDFELAGSARAGDRIQLVADGGLALARAIVVGRNGRWRASVDTGAMIDPAVSHRLVAWSPASGQSSDPVKFTVLRHWTEVADILDPAGDDLGPHGTYLYPTDPSWAGRTLDIRRVRVETAGGALRVSVRMAALSRAWDPPNGFDHVAFNLFVQLPGQAGQGMAAMPGQHDELPEGMRWNRRLRTHGWSNALFSAQGASAQADGQATVPAAAITVDPATDTVSFTIAASALGNPVSLSGARLLLNTWDYDGGFRPLEPRPAGSRFGGGDGARDPLWMDASAVIELP